MAVPKKKTSHSKKGMRRSHHKLESLKPVQDPHSDDFTLPHKVSPAGYYKGRKVFETKADA